MAESAFQVTYDGPALSTGRMEVRDLAPALLAIGDLFAEASVLAHPDKPPVALNIEATEEGSFVVQLILENAWDHIVDVFGSNDMMALLALKEAILGTGTGLIWLLKRLHGRKIVDQAATPEPGHITLRLDDGTTLTVPTHVLELYSNIDIRRHVRQVVQPLDRPGIEEVRFRSEDQVSITIRSEEIGAFAVPADEQVPLQDDVRQMFVSIASVAFKETNKWRLSDGNNTFWASMLDNRFLHRVDQGIEVFRKGDMLRCRMRIVQSRSSEGLHTDYEVHEVYEHIPRPTQLRLGDA